jgi:hypothetical protein
MPHKLIVKVYLHTVSVRKVRKGGFGSHRYERVTKGWIVSEGNWLQVRNELTLQDAALMDSPDCS